MRNRWSHQERLLQMHTTCIVTRIGFKPATRRGCVSYCEKSAVQCSDCSVTCGYGRKTSKGICLKEMSTARSRQWVTPIVIVTSILRLIILLLGDVILYLAVRLLTVTFVKKR